jgi:hypothetical protein
VTCVFVGLACSIFRILKGPAVAKSPETVVAIFKAAGLEAEEPVTMGPRDYGLAPLLATKGLRFLIPSLGPDSGGRIMQFSSDSDLESVRSQPDGPVQQHPSRRALS